MAQSYNKEQGESMENTNLNNGTDPTAANQTTVERTERNKYKKIPILFPEIIRSQSKFRLFPLKSRRN